MMSVYLVIGGDREHNSVLGAFSDHDAASREVERLTNMGCDDVWVSEAQLDKPIHAERLHKVGLDSGGTVFHYESWVSFDKGDRGPWFNDRGDFFYVTYGATTKADAIKQTKMLRENLIRQGMEKAPNV